jgi:hypothetical protein
VTNPPRQTPLEPAKTANLGPEIKLTPAFSELFSLAAKLAPEDQALVAKGIVSASGDPRYVETLTKLLASRDFQELSPDDKNAVLTYAKNHSSKLDLDRNWVMKLMLDTGYEERYREKEVAKFSRHEQDLVHEIETQRGCRSNEGFKQWLSLRPPADRDFYDVVYVPLLNPGPLGRRNGEVLPKPPAVHSAADVQPMLEREQRLWDHSRPRPQGEWAEQGAMLQLKLAPGQILYLEGADGPTVEFADGLLMVGGAVAPPIGASASSPSRAPEVQDMSRSAPAPEVGPLPRPNAPYLEVEAPAAPTPTTNPTIGELQPAAAAAPTAATPGFNKLNGPVTPASPPAPFTFNGNPPFAFPPVPRGLSTEPVRQSGGTPAHAGAPAQTGSSRPAGGRRQPGPVDPNTQRMAGGDKPKGDGPDGPPVPPRVVGGPAEPAAAPRFDPEVEIKRLEEAAIAAEREFQRLERQVVDEDSWDGVLTDTREQFEKAQVEYQRARALYEAALERERVLREIAREPYPTPLNPIREFDQIYQQSVEYGHQLSWRSRTGSTNIERAIEETGDRMHQAALTAAAELARLPEEVTPEFLLTVEAEAAKARKDYGAALAKVAYEQEHLQGNVSMETIDGYKKARAKYQETLNADEMLATHPSYWEYQLDKCKKQTNISREAWRSAWERFTSESGQPGGVSKPTQDRYDEATRAYGDAQAVEEQVLKIRNEWQYVIERIRRSAIPMGGY